AESGPQAPGHRQPGRSRSPPAGTETSGSAPPEHDPEVRTSSEEGAPRRKLGSTVVDMLLFRPRGPDQSRSIAGLLARPGPTDRRPGGARSRWGAARPIQR